MRTWRPLAAVAAICSISTAMASCATHNPDPRDADERVGASADKLVVNCKYLDQAQYPQLPVAVDFDHEIVIRDLSVVEDPCRTAWTATGCAAGTLGVWTFGHLMSQMAGTTPPEQFVAEWVHTFELNQTINGFPVPPRSNVRSELIDPWLVASGCPAGADLVGTSACALDLKKAPFRLLAIVNRADLSGPAYGAENPGEARFVFGMLQLTGGEGGGGKTPPPKGSSGGEAKVALEATAALTVDPGGKGEPVEGGAQLEGNALKGTVILEYRVPPGPKLIDWASTWHELSSLPLGDPAFNPHLQTITDVFSSQGADPSRPNLGSSIGQVRTNEIALGDGWELRQFELQDVGGGFDGFALNNAPVSQTPDDTVNNTTPLDGWLIANEADILNVDHVVPASFIGGVSHEVGVVWGVTATPPLDPAARHFFAQQTCNGCHDGENPGTPFTHIGTRGIGSVAPLSAFLGESPAPDPAINGLPASIQTIPDSLFSSIPREYNEPWRRVCEITRILDGDPDPYTRGNGGVH